MSPRPRELLSSGSDDERARARKAVSARIHSGWSEERALDTPIGAKPGPVAGYRHANRGAARASVAGVHIDATTPYADDVEAQRLVAEHPDGMTLEQVGDVLGVTRERVRQIEAGALKSLRLRCALAGIEPEDVAAMLAGKRESSPSGAVAAGRPIAAPRSVGEEPLPPAAWSEHGQRVEAALRELEDVSERLRRMCA